MRVVFIELLTSRVTAHCENGIVGETQGSFVSWVLLLWYGIMAQDTL